MFKYTKTSVFNANTQTIVNTVNCVGVMGAGLALEFKLRFPKMYSNYVGLCRRGEIQVGKVNLYNKNYHCNIINFPTKIHWKNPSDLAWIEAGLEDFRRQYRKWGITSIAFPKLGCDRGGLDWQVVDPLMDRYLHDLKDLDVYICLDTERNAQGVEKKMLDLLQIPELWSGKLNLTSSQKVQISQSLPLNRFRDLAKIPGIGKKVYQEMFKLLYTQACEAMEFETQYFCLEDKINQNIFTIEESRIRLVIFLYQLGLPCSTISSLTRKNISQQQQQVIISIPPKQQFTIPDKTWQKLGFDLSFFAADQPLVCHKRNKDKPLKPSTVKKLITQGNSLLSKPETRH